jgi:protein tyrosine phosphatase (PTP) superfamily phosphohydrolase (DUF442 family)
MKIVIPLSLMKNIIYLIFFLLIQSACAEVKINTEVRVRNGEWANQIIGSTLSNWYKINNDIYRSKQPDEEDFKQINKFGIKSVLNLRYYHDDNDETKGLKLRLFHLPLNAGGINQKDIINAIRIINDAEKPLLIHCWHGSDRTGAVIAAYRIVFDGWSVNEAIDEMINGGYGFHSFYSNIPKLLKSIDWKEIKTKMH